MPRTTVKKLANFLRESNAIEGVYDDDSMTQACAAWNYLIKEDKLTPEVIKETHRLLMINQNLFDWEKGYFRKCPVYIGGRSGLNWVKIPARIKEWCEAVMSENPTHDPKTLHVLYEEIHPFVDGNGRTGRMFMNWQRLRQGLPLLVIKADERGKYYKWFKQNDKKREKIH